MPQTIIKYDCVFGVFECWYWVLFFVFNNDISIIFYSLSRASQMHHSIFHYVEWHRIPTNTLYSMWFISRISRNDTHYTLLPIQTTHKIHVQNTKQKIKTKHKIIVTKSLDLLFILARKNQHPTMKKHKIRQHAANPQLTQNENKTSNTNTKHKAQAQTIIYFHCIIIITLSNINKQTCICEYNAIIANNHNHVLFMILFQFHHPWMHYYQW